MLIKGRVERGVKSLSHCYDAVCSLVTETANQQRGEEVRRMKIAEKAFLR